MNLGVDGAIICRGNFVTNCLRVGGYVENKKQVRRRCSPFFAYASSILSLFKLNDVPSRNTTHLQLTWFYLITFFPVMVFEFKCTYKRTPFPQLFLDEILMIRGQLARPCFVMAWCLTTASGEWRLDGPQWCSGDCHASGGTAGPWYGRWPRSIATDVRKRCQRAEEMGAAVCNWKPLRSFEHSSLVRDLDCFGGISTSRPAPMSWECLRSR